jgi:hypothetical protein
MTTKNRQRWVLPPLGAHWATCRILLISSSGTGSGFSRRIASIVLMTSKMSVVSDMASSCWVEFPRLYVSQPAASNATSATITPRKRTSHGKQASPAPGFPVCAE